MVSFSFISSKLSPGPNFSGMTEEYYMKKKKSVLAESETFLFGFSTQEVWKIQTHSYFTSPSNITRVLSFNNSSMDFSCKLSKTKVPNLGEILPSRGHLTMSGDIVGCHIWRIGGLLASRGDRSGVQLNILQCTGQLGNKELSSPKSQ